MNYTHDNLIEAIRQLPFDEDTIHMEEKQFDYDDCVAVVTGRVYADFRYEQGDYFVPPSSTMIGISAFIDDIYLRYEENEEFMTGEDIDYIQKQLNRWRLWY